MNAGFDFSFRNDLGMCVSAFRIPGYASLLPLLVNPPFTFKLAICSNNGGMGVQSGDVHANSVSNNSKLESVNVLSVFVHLSG